MLKEAILQEINSEEFKKKHCIPGQKAQTRLIDDVDPGWRERASEHL